jgi:topoisomerase-4 subunit A
VAVALVHDQLACLSLSGHLLVFALDEVKLQSNGGRGLTLMAVDAKDPLLSVATFHDALVVHGASRAGKPKEETLRGAALAGYAGKRARKGKLAPGMKAGRRVLAG